MAVTQMTKGSISKQLIQYSRYGDSWKVCGS